MPEPVSLSNYRAQRRHAYVIRGLTDRAGNAWGGASRRRLFDFWKRKLRDLKCQSAMQLQTINDRPVLRLLCDKPAREELEGLVQRLRGELSAPSLAVCSVSPDVRADENYLAAAYVVVFHSASVQIPQVLTNHNGVLDVQALRKHARDATRLFLLHCKTVEAAQSVVRNQQVSIRGQQLRVEAPRGLAAPAAAAPAAPAPARAVGYVGGGARAQGAAPAAAPRRGNASWADVAAGGGRRDGRAARQQPQPARPQQAQQPDPANPPPDKVLQYLCHAVKVIADHVGASLLTVGEWLATLQADQGAVAVAAGAVVAAPVAADAANVAEGEHAAVVAVQVAEGAAAAAAAVDDDAQFEVASRQRRRRRVAAAPAVAAAAPEREQASQQDDNTAESARALRVLRRAAARIYQSVEAARGQPVGGSAASTQSNVSVSSVAAEAAGPAGADLLPRSHPRPRAPVLVLRRGTRAPQVPDIAQLQHDDDAVVRVEIPVSPVPIDHHGAAGAAAASVGAAASAASGNGAKCAICQSRSSEHPSAAAEPCGHRFHVPCLTSWFNQSSSCPTCRKNIAAFDGHQVELRVQRMSPNAERMASEEAVAALVQAEAGGGAGAGAGAAN